MEYEARSPASISIGGQVSGQNVVIGGTQTVHGDLSIAVGTLPNLGRRPGIAGSTGRPANYFDLKKSEG
jgi:hypothetical protein